MRERVAVGRSENDHRGASRRRIITLSAVLTVGASLVVATKPASAAIPGDATAVSVQAGVTTADVDADLASAASISGTVTGSDGKPVGSVDVLLFDADRKPVSQGDYDGEPFVNASGSTGRFRIPALNAGTYYLCFRPNRSFYDASSRNSATYVDTCLGGVTFPLRSNAVPAETKSVTLARSQQLTGVDVTLPKGAAITGTVRASTSSTDHPASTVSVYNRSSGDVLTTTTGQPLKSGVYLATGLAPSAKGYTVCFDPREATPVSSKLGYLGQCWKGAAWTPGGPQTSSATAVKVAAGRTATGISAVLKPGGAITGRVRYSNGDATGTVEVRAYNATGRVLTSATTDSAGVYKLRGLPASRAEKVCALPQGANSLGRCWRNAAYSSGAPPRTASNVTVHLARTTSGIDIRVAPTPRRTYPKPATISGTLSQAGGGTPTRITVTAFDAKTGKGVASVQNDLTGSADFTLDIPRPGTFVVCAKRSPDVDVDASTAPGTAPACFGAAWDGGGAPPKSATTITLAEGGVRNGVKLALPQGGAVAGVVTADGRGAFSQVSVVNAHGQTVGHAYPYDDATGAYKIIGLTPAADYRVCFNGAPNDPAPDGDVGRLPECFDNVPWNAPVPQAEYGSD